ncbi:MAG: argininosuccinate lyase [Planctomycetota bacterium]
MAKLWQKTYTLDKLMEAFTVGDDHLLDRHLIVADCVGSIAHGAMLAKIGVLTKAEFKALKAGLVGIIKNAADFPITLEDEDVHTAVENYLTAKLGDAGKKIHTGRSRNDQIIVDTRLYSKGFLFTFQNEALSLVHELHAFAEKHKAVPMVGRTHMQVAMPSSVGLWAGAMAESLLDDLEVVQTAYKLNDQCPLGSAASYGIPLPLDREMVARSLGFAKVQNNVLYANNSRGKIESVILQAIQQTVLTLSKMAQDLILWSMPEFGYFTLPDELCSGSSIMPQKKNPCGLELVRAKAAVIEGCVNTVTGIIKGLPSGYNRDLQATKGPFITGCNTGIMCVEVCALTIRKLQVNRERCIAAFTPEVFATDKALELVADGMPFRDAYKHVGTHLDQLKNEDPVAAIRKKTHTGTTGNLKLGVIAAGLKAGRSRQKKAAAAFDKALRSLTGLKDVTVYRKPYGT